MQSIIATRASELSRSIYASLPFGYRVAHLLVQLKLATVNPKTYGSLFYAAFIRAGVTGMPDIDGEPAETWRPKLLKDFDRYSLVLYRKKYGWLFGTQMWGLGMKLLQKEEDVEDILQKTSAELIGGSQHRIRSYDLEQAQSFVKKMIAWRAQDIQRGAERRKELLVPGPVVKRKNIPELMVEQVDPQQMSAFKWELMRGAPQSALRAVDPSHPNRAWDWVEAQLEGRTNRELAAEWGVVPSTINEWLKTYLPKIRNVLRPYAEAV